MKNLEILLRPQQNGRIGRCQNQQLPHFPVASGGQGSFPLFRRPADPSTSPNKSMHDPNSERRKGGERWGDKLNRPSAAIGGEGEDRRSQVGQGKFVEAR